MADPARAAAKLDEVVATLRDLQDKGLTRQLTKALNKATEELRREAQERAGEILPQRGGLAEIVEHSKLSTRRRGGRNPGIRIAAKGLAQLENIDRKGEFRHPVWGNRNVWVTQKVASGWFTRPMFENQDDVTRRIDQALDELAAELARRLSAR